MNIYELSGIPGMGAASPFDAYAFNAFEADGAGIDPRTLRTPRYGSTATGSKKIHVGKPEPAITFTRDQVQGMVSRGVNRNAGMPVFKLNPKLNSNPSPGINTSTQPQLVMPDVVPATTSALQALEPATTISIGIEETETPPEKKSNKGLIIGASVVGVALITALAISAGSKPKATGMGATPKPNKPTRTHTKKTTTKANPRSSVGKKTPGRQSAAKVTFN